MRRRATSTETYGVYWNRVGAGSVSERRVPDGMPVAARRAWMYAEHARAAGASGERLLAKGKPAARRRKLRGVSDAEIRYARMQMGREGECWVRALIWLLRLLAPGGWRGPILERNRLKRERVLSTDP